MMTDVSNVSETPSVVEAIPSETHSYETVEVLYHQAKQAVESQTYDRAIEVLIALDKDQYEGKIDFFRVFDIIQDLWTQAPHEAQKLRALDFQTFVMKVEGTRVGCTTIDNSESRLFYFEPQTTENAQNLIGKGTDLFEKENFHEFEISLRNILEAHANYCVSNEALSSFIFNLCDTNVVVAERFFPLINEFIKVELEGDTLKVQANTYFVNSYNSSYCFRVVEDGLKVIAEEEDVDDRIRLYGKLAKMHESRASEILKLAEAELSKLEASDQVSAILELSPLYVQCKNGKGLKVLTPKLEASLDRVIESAKIARQLSLSFHYAMIALAENDKQAFENHLSSLKQAAETDLDDEIREGIEESLEKLEALGEKTFPTDPMVLKEQKV